MTLPDPGSASGPDLSQASLSGDALLAAELALGVLEGPDRVTALQRFEADPAFQTQVLAWAERLGGFDPAPVPPPPLILQQIQERVASEPPSALAPLLRRIAVWRRVTLSLALGVLALVGVVAWLLLNRPEAAALAPVPPQPPPPPPGPERFAVLASAEAPPALVVDLQGARLSFARGDGLDLPPGRVAELWAVPPDGGPPRSLGVLSTAEIASRTLPDGALALLSEGVILAISDEPPGGSPTGAPTGTVRATGPLRRWQ